MNFDSIRKSLEKQSDDQKSLQSMEIEKQKQIQDQQMNPKTPDQIAKMDDSDKKILSFGQFGANQPAHIGIPRKDPAPTQVRNPRVDSGNSALVGMTMSEISQVFRTVDEAQAIFDERGYSITV
jgi:hypothetical protein